MGGVQAAQIHHVKRNSIKDAVQLVGGRAYAKVHQFYQLDNYLPNLKTKSMRTTHRLQVRDVRKKTARNVTSMMPMMKQMITY